MAKVCHVCGKKPVTGNNVSHAHNKTRRRWLAESAIGSHGYRRWWGTPGPGMYKVHSIRCGG
jgi:hypothetical protein